MHQEKWLFYLKEPRLSLKAKGLLSIIDVWPDNIEHYLSSLISVCNDKAETVKNAMCELERFGYVKTFEVPKTKKYQRKDYIWKKIEYMWR